MTKKSNEIEKEIVRQLKKYGPQRQTELIGKVMKALEDKTGEPTCSDGTVRTVLGTAPNQNFLLYSHSKKAKYYFLIDQIDNLVKRVVTEHNVRAIDIASKIESRKMHAKSIHETLGLWIEKIPTIDVDFYVRSYDSYLNLTAGPLECRPEFVEMLEHPEIRNSVEDRWADLKRSFSAFEGMKNKLWQEIHMMLTDYFSESVSVHLTDTFSKTMYLMLFKPSPNFNLDGMKEWKFEQNGNDLWVVRNGGTQEKCLTVMGTTVPKRSMVHSLESKMKALETVFNQDRHRDSIRAINDECTKLNTKRNELIYELSLLRRTPIFSPCSISK